MLQVARPLFSLKLLSLFLKSAFLIMVNCYTLHHTQAVPGTFLRTDQ